MNTLLIAKTLLGCLTRNLRISRDAARNLSQILVESKADVVARARCFSPPPSYHLSLTICLADVAKLHSHGPSTTTKPMLLQCIPAQHRRV